MLPISERMAMAISITNDIICDFLTGMILFLYLDALIDFIDKSRYFALLLYRRIENKDFFEFIRLQMNNRFSLGDTRNIIFSN